jgi:hypothetical protein
MMPEGIFVRNQLCRSFQLQKRGVSMLDSNKYQTKTYLHFDHRVKIENAESYVTNPKRIARHIFLPFIHYVDSFEKYTGERNIECNNRPIKEKNRKIMYAGHWDNFIYKYYADEILNPKYNKFCLDRGRLSSLDKSSLNLLSEIVQSHHATIYQILLAWSIRDGNTIAISKSSNQEHIISNVQSATIKLMNNELIEIDKLFKKPITKTTLALW